MALMLTSSSLFPWLGTGIAISQDWYSLVGPPDYTRPLFRGSPRWTTWAGDPSMRLAVPEAAAGLPMVVPNASAGQVVEAGQGLGFYGG